MVQPKEIIDVVKQYQVGTTEAYQFLQAKKKGHAFIFSNDQVYNPFNN